MIEFKTERNYLMAVHDHCLPYMSMFKATRLRNMANKPHDSEEYLGAVLMNCLLSEVEKYLKQKIYATTGKVIRLKFNDAQGIVLYKSLLAIPLPKDQYYLQQVRNEWVMILDQALIENKILQPKAAYKEPSGGVKIDEYGD